MSRLYREELHHSPRLFECSNQTGQFRMTEVDDFDQCDLDEEDVMLLDTWEEVRGPCLVLKYTVVLARGSCELEDLTSYMRNWETSRNGSDI